MVSLLVSSKSRTSEVAIILRRKVGSTFVRTKVQLATLKNILFFYEKTKYRDCEI